MREYTNEEQLDRFADLLDPIIEIANDPEAQELATHSPAAWMKAVIKNHKSAFIQILASFEGVPAEEYEVPDPLALLVKAMQMINRPEISALFPSRGQKEASESSGSAMGNTEDGAV